MPTAIEIPAYRELINNKNGTQTLRKNFHKGQTQAWESTKRFIFLLAGNQSGKTVFGCDWLYREIDTCGEGDYLIVSATFPLLEKKLEREFLTLFQDYHNLGKYNFSKKVFQFYDSDSRVFLCSADNPGSIESVTANAAWLDECGQEGFGRQAWDAVLRRVGRATGFGAGRILGTTTLYNISGWLKNEIYLRWLEGDPDIDVIQFDSIDCPGFPRDEYERAKATMPSWKFDLFYRGRYSKPAGLIYDAFDEKTCIIKRFPIPKEWTCYVGMDFGGSNTAAVFFALEPTTGNLYGYREYLAGGMSAAEHAQALRELSKDENIIKRVGGAASEDGWRESFSVADWRVSKPYIKDVEVGIDRVYAFHKLNKMFLFDDMTRLLEDFQTYSRELDERYEATEKIKEKERFHLCLIEGTQIQIIDGAKPIEDVKVGDLVATRQGYSPVMASGMTQNEADTITVGFSNGTSLTGTGEHPIYIQGKGFVPLNSVRYYDMIETWKEKPLTSTELPITDTLKRRDGLTVFILGHPLGIFTVPFGKMPLGKFLKAIIYTIKTIIHSTIIYLILWLKRVSHTFRNIMQVISTILNILSGYSLLQRNGIAHQKAEDGIVNTGNKVLPIESQLNLSAKCVVGSIKAFPKGEIDFVLTDAERLIATRLEAIMKFEFAQSVKANLSEINTQEQLPVQEHAEESSYVLSVRVNCKQPVYNLTVDTVHEYFANGVLVSNCDAVRYIISEFNAGIPQSSKVKVWRFG